MELDKERALPRNTRLAGGIGNWDFIPPSYKSVKTPLFLFGCQHQSLYTGGSQTLAWPEYSQGFVKHRLLSFQLNNSRFGLRVCTFHKLPSDNKAFSGGDLTLKTTSLDSTLIHFFCLEKE